ncbi:MAG: bifunctional diaminohydroxyphosphoribosylaminopyrimidine deaminase/5-amino-6-(5-phosphoribosylamino)uracil reductase RibD [Rhodobacteraceae bacterium]|nr:bifunctional diaminohydroxyphosphoribosylaminopyrimidine deaminase/5-amino-6-(5-phosphoribosylamino)uracil reductase RibD [Paracoccaceae bacterium]
MALALSLGRRGLGRVWPNPAVGCVIVKDGRIVGRGSTALGGRPHAEPQALQQAGPAARGAAAYVSLEPCAHDGQTPPCTDALIAAGIARVVTAMEDPDPRVSGKGHAALKAAGIAVRTGVLADEAARDQAGFLSRIIHGRPRLTLKLAASFDGRIATASGESQWITGPAARRMVHAMRMRHDAVLVGGGTARADDPMLTVRDLGVTHQPVRLVASRHLNLPQNGRLAQSAAQIPLWLLHGDRPGDLPTKDHETWAAHGATCVPVAVGPSGQLDPAAMLDALGGLGLTRVFCEGGGALAASLLNAGLVDELVGFTAGIALGAEGQPALGAMGVAELDGAARFDLVEATAVGDDLLHRWRRRN